MRAIVCWLVAASGGCWALACVAPAPAPGADADAKGSGSPISLDGESAEVPAGDSEVAADGGSDGAAPFSLESTVYVQFILNTHDWVFPQDSIATLHHVVDLHEQYRVPVEIYLTDPVLQVYLAQAPDLVERLRTSPQVAVSHHVRPPAPYDSGFDWLGLDALSDSDLAALLLTYEEHALDLSTGQPTAEAGGYELLKKTMGYAPYVVTMAAGKDRVSKALAQIYTAKGALFTLVHSQKGTAWGETANGLWLRPETVEVKAYERKDDVDFETKIWAPAMDEVGDTRPAWVNLKWHEDNFYVSGTPWGNVYFSDAQDKTMKPPPYDITAYEPVERKTAVEQATQWKRYETALQYVLAHADTCTPIGSRDLKALAGL